jgi:hypothetical protein
MENVAYLNCLGSLITEEKCVRGIKSRIAMAKAAFSNKKALLTGSLYLNLRKKLVNCYRDADKSLARPGRKQATATEDFDAHISYL